jgi:hypothetical protein
MLYILHKSGPWSRQDECRGLRRIQDAWVVLAKVPNKNYGVCCMLVASLLVPSRNDLDPDEMVRLGRK